MGAPVRFRVKGSNLYISPLNASAYDVAGRGRRGRDWTPGRYGPNLVMLHAADKLQRRSRDAVRNVGYADTIIDVLVANLIGTGIKPKFSTPDAGLNRELAQLFLEWTDEADADGAFDFYGLQALAVRAMIEGGESFVRFRPRRPADELTVPLQLQMLESEYCPYDKNELVPGGGEIRMGIQLNAVGRRQAYWLYRAHPDDSSLNRRAEDTLPVAVPAETVAHLRQMRRPGQLRGEPWLTRTLIKLKDLDAYDDAELVRKKTAALFAGFITRPAPETDEHNPALDEEADWEEPEAGPIATLEPGTMQVLEPGESVAFSEPAEVGGQYKDFMTVQLRAIASMAGVLYEHLTGDYSTINDRTYRAAIGEFRRRITMLQHHLVAFQFCRPTGQAWLNAVYANGVIKPPANMDNRAARRVLWVPQAWPYLHPVQDVQAARDAVRSGFKSRKQVVDEAGDDIDQVDAEIAADNARADASGFVFDSDPRKSSAAGLTQARPQGTVLPPTDVPEEEADGREASER